MNFIKNIWEVLGKAWELFVTVVLPALQNKKNLDASLEEFKNKMLEKYPDFFNNVCSLTERCTTMTKQISSLYADKTELLNVVSELKEEIKSLKNLFCKSAPTCKLAVK